VPEPQSTIWTRLDRGLTVAHRIGLGLSVALLGYALLPRETRHELHALFRRDPPAPNCAEQFAELRTALQGESPAGMADDPAARVLARAMLDAGDLRGAEVLLRESPAETVQLVGAQVFIYRYSCAAGRP
jgi:hypothetical protein